MQASARRWLFSCRSLLQAAASHHRSSGNTAKTLAGKALAAIKKSP
jgi:hypothetical protein